MGIEIIDGLVAIVTAVIAAVTALISLLLTPEWVNGTLFGLDVHLKKMWILVSNIVYFIFAFLLIGIAFMNIIGQGGDTYQLKKALPKFIVGVLIVPFSWFLVQFILSISAVLTTSVLTLPFDSFNDLKGRDSKPMEKMEKKDPTFMDRGIICNKYTINLAYNDKDKDKDSSWNLEAVKKRLGIGENSSTEGYFYCDSENKKSLKKVLGLSRSGGDYDPENIYGIMAIYTFGIMNLAELPKMNLSIKTVLTLGIKVIFNLLFVAVYLLLIIALALALFVRGFRLWIYVMLSPAFGLTYFFYGSSSGEGALKNFSIKEFINLALVPVYVSFALSFGLLFILVSDGLSINDSASFLDNGEFDFGITKIALTGIVDTQKEDTLSTKLLNGNGSALGTLIMQLISLGILRIGVMAALNSSSITKTVVEPIVQFGNSIGSIAKSAPGYIPIIPTPKGVTTAAGLSIASTNIKEGLRTKYGSDMGRRLYDPTSTKNKVQKIKTYVTEKVKGTLTQYQRTTHMEGLLSAAGPINDWQGSGEIKTALQEALEKIGIKADFKKKSGVEAISSAIHEALHPSNSNSLVDRYTNRKDLENFMRNVPTDSTDPKKYGTPIVTHAESGNNTVTLRYGSVNAKISNTRKLTEYDYQQLARAVGEGLQGDELRGALNNMSILGDKQEDTLEEIAGYLTKDTDGKIEFNPDGGGKNVPIQDFAPSKEDSDESKKDSDESNEGSDKSNEGSDKSNEGSDKSNEGSDKSK